MTSNGVRLVMTVDAVGGVWQCALDLARALHPLGYATVLALLGPDPSPAQSASAEAVAGCTLVRTGLTLDWLAADAAGVAAAGQRLAAIADEVGASLVHLNHPAFAAASPFRVPVVAAAHSCVATWWRAVQTGPLPPDFAWRTEATGAGLRAADRVVCPSAAFAVATQAAYGLPARPNVVYNGRSMLVPGATSCERLGRFALTAGRLWDVGKNVAALDRAAARLSVPVKAAGPTMGPHGEAAPSTPHLQLLGLRSETELARLLAMRPVFVSAAFYEPFGLAVLEAAAAGCALVLADIRSFRELWDDAAVFVHPQDDAAIAAAVAAFVRDRTSRLAYGDRARRRAERFTPAAMAAGMADLYRLACPAAAALDLGAHLEFAAA